MPSESRWAGDAILQRLEAQLKKNVQAAAIHLTNKVKRNVNKTQPYRISGTVRIGLKPSRPGDYWKKITGFGQKSIAWEMTGPTSARVGSNVKYVKFLELGTSKMGARPALRKTLKAEQSKIVSILSRKL